MLANEHKDYPSLKVDVINGEKVVFKDITEIEVEFFDRFTNIDYVLYPIKIKGNKAYYPFCSGGTIIGKSKEAWEKIVRNVARLGNVAAPTDLKLIHGSSKGHYLSRLQEVEDLAKSSDIRLCDAGLDFIRAKIDKLDFTECITHDDLIALNILVDRDAIKIIDWEHVKLSFRESDIGRLLGDLYFDQPRRNKYYYPESWHDSLVDVYLKETKRLNPSYDMRIGAENVLFSKLWNHLLAIRATLKGKNMNSDWLQANVGSFNGLCEKF